MVQRVILISFGRQLSLLDRQRVGRLGKLLFQVFMTREYGHDSATVSKVRHIEGTRLKVGIGQFRKRTIRLSKRKINQTRRGESGALRVV